MVWMEVIVVLVGMGLETRVMVVIVMGERLRWDSRGGREALIRGFCGSKAA